MASIGDTSLRLMLRLPSTDSSIIRLMPLSRANPSSMFLMSAPLVSREIVLISTASISVAATELGTLTSPMQYSGISIIPMVNSRIACRYTLTVSIALLPFF